MRTKDVKCIKNNKKTSTQEKGITLVALVIVSVIILILIFTLLGILLHSSLVETSLSQSEQEASKSEQDYSKYIGAYVMGYNPKPVTSSNPYVVSGMSGYYYQEQTFTTETDMLWRIWDYDGKLLTLISDKPTRQELILSGAQRI